MAESGGALKRTESVAQSEAPSSAASLVPTSVVAAYAAATLPEAVPAATASTAPTPEKNDGAAVKIVSFAGLTRTLSTAEDVADVIASINNEPMLTDIVMGGNTIGLEAMNAITDTLVQSEQANLSLKRLDFDDVFTRRKEEELHPSLVSLGNVISAARLNEIALCDNALNPEGARILAPILAKKCPGLQILRLDNTGVGPLGGKFLGLGLLEGARQGLRLKVFSLGRSRMEKKGSTAVAEALKTMGSLEEINMPQNGIRSAGMIAVAGAVAENPELKVLNLNDNTFGKESCVAMAKAFASCAKLEQLNLGDCLLRSAGFGAIGAALAGNANLKMLDLTYNELKEANLDTLIKLLTGKVQLEKLEINGNIFSEASIEAIATCVDGNGGKLADVVLGDIDEMEDPDEDEDSDGDGEEDSDSDLDDVSEDEEGAADVADLLKNLNM